jgi:hypothetical protein
VSKTVGGITDAPRGESLSAAAVRRSGTRAGAEGGEERAIDVVAGMQLDVDMVVD